MYEFVSVVYRRSVTMRYRTYSLCVYCVCILPAHECILYGVLYGVLRALCVTVLCVVCRY